MRMATLYTGSRLMVLCLASTTAVGCRAPAGGGPDPTTSPHPVQTPPRAAGSTDKQHEDFDPKTFSRPTSVDNPYTPMKPGTRLTYEGTTIEDDGTAVPHRVIINVTDLTKVIA